MAVRTVVLTASLQDAVDYCLEHDLPPSALRCDYAGEVLVVWPRVIDRVRGCEADRIESTPAALTSPRHADMLTVAEPAIAACNRHPQQEGSTMQTPSLGRVVIVHGLDPALSNGATEAPAVITRVWSDACVNLQVFVDEANAPVWKTSVVLYADDAEIREGHTYYATWPTRT